MAKANAGCNIAAAMEALVKPTVEELGFRLWDVEYVKEGTAWYLRFTIDHDDGVDIDGCEKVHRAIEPLIDEADPIPDFYYLEVSSPGLERTLRTEAHFRWAVGQTVVLKFYHEQDGAKAAKGILRELGADGGLLLEMPDGTMPRFPKEAIARANLFYDFTADDVES